MLKYEKKAVLILITAILLLPFQSFGAEFSPGKSNIEKVSSFSKDKAVPVKAKTPGISRYAVETAQEKMIPVIIKLEDPSLATFMNETDEMRVSDDGTRTKSKLDVTRKINQDYLKSLKISQENFISVAKSSIRSAKVTHRFDVVFGGVSMLVPESELENLKKLPGVISVFPDELVHTNTNVSNNFMGSPDLWNNLGGNDKAGEGVIIGIIDTGVWPEHMSFSDPDPSGNSYQEPPEKWLGTLCDFGSEVPGDDRFSCNNKLIGAARFMDTYDSVLGLLPTEFPTTRDDNGHGTHTGSTAGGNYGVEADLLGRVHDYVSGVAPRAHLSFYKCLGEQGGFTSDLVAGIQQAIADGVDVINYSISGGGQPYSQPAELAFLDAYGAGVFVAASAGNSGPTPETVAHRGPWVTTVAASMSDRLFLTDLVLYSDDGDSISLQGSSITAGIDDPIEIVFPPEGQEQCLDPFTEGVFDDKIVICQRGGGSRIAKTYNVMRGSAAGMVLYNINPDGLSTDNCFLPSVYLDQAEGIDLLEFIATHTGITASFEEGSATEVQGDVMAAFSSRGGPLQTLEISKPDVTAPGVAILAGNTPMAATMDGGSPGNLFQAIQGTSMSSPHVAGAAALLKDLHEEWTPGQIKSALMTTAITKNVVKEDGETEANSFDYGSGRIDLEKAGDPGITFDIAAEDFIYHQFDLKNVNYPSLYLPVMPGRVTVERTVHSELDYDSYWRIFIEKPNDIKISVPRYLHVAAGADESFEITVDARQVPIGEVRHARLHLYSHERKAIFPITIVRNEPVVTVSKTCDPPEIKWGEETDFTIKIQNTTFEDASVSVRDILPLKLMLVNGTTEGASEICNGVEYSGMLRGAEPAIVSSEVVSGSSPAGYLPLAGFGGNLEVDASDESITNYNVPEFKYAGETYSSVGIVSNGYVVVGGGVDADVMYENSELPNESSPNNILCPFWTDLNPDDGGRILLNTLSDGVTTWIVVEWEQINNYGMAEPNTFQIWIECGENEGVHFTYGPEVSTGLQGALTVGAENKFGNTGNSVYFNGAGTPPVPTSEEGYEIAVSSIPGEPGETHEITFTAFGWFPGKWTNYVKMESNMFDGENIASCPGKTEWLRVPPYWKNIPR